MRTPTKTAAGTWKVRFRYNQRQTSETFDTRRAADRFCRLLDALGPAGALDQLYAGDQAPDVPRLNAIAADHIAHLTGIEPGTRSRYLRMWDRIWSPRLGFLPANQVTRDDVALAINELAQGYARKSLENQRGLLVGVLNRAVDLGHLPNNPAKGMRLPRGKESERTEMRIVTPDEFDVVVEGDPELLDDDGAAIAPGVHEHYRPLVRFMYGTGARWGEATALEVRDVQLPNVRIRRAVKYTPDGGRVVGVTKTKKSNRTVLLPHELHAELRELCRGKAGIDLVFTAPRGGYVLHRTFWSRVWLPAVRHLEPRPRIHDLRHSHASVLPGNGVPPHVVQARLGHESIKTTVDTYSHLMPDAQVAAAAAAGAAFVGATRAASPEEIAAQARAELLEQLRAAGVDVGPRALEGRLT